MKRKAYDKLLHDIERHCNNYFNPRNDPAGPRDYPPEFLTLAAHIEQFNGNPESWVSALPPDFPEIKSGDYIPWQLVFKDELAIYKRLKTI